MTRRPPTTAFPLRSPAEFGWAQIKQGFARRDLVPAIPAAMLCWFLTIIFSVSLAALIFRGVLGPFLPLGVGMSMVTAIAVGLVTLFTSSIPGCVAIPSDRTAPMLAILAGSIAADFPAGDPKLLPTVLAALIFATALSGIVLWLLGHYRMGILVRFLPYPVVGGFMAGAGWLLVKGGFTVATGTEMSFATFSQLFTASTIPRWAPSLAVALAILVAARRSRHFLVIPSIVVASLLLFYASAWIMGLTLPEMRAIGWLPPASQGAVAWHPFLILSVQTTDWSMITSHFVTFATIVMVSAISILMIASSLELVAKVEVNADRELQTAGLANMASLLTGGIVGFHSLSITTLSLRVGPNSRWVGLFTVVGTLLTLVFVPNLISYLPVPLLSALLLYLGLNFLTEWLYDSIRRMRRTDYLIIVLIVVVVAWAGYLIGVGVGLVMALTLFALRYSLIDVVRLELSGAQHRSNVDRHTEELAVLQPMRPSIHILKLQGFIFFGTAYSLLQRVRSRALGDDVPLRYLILDFRHVTGVDSSALLSLAKLLHMGEQADFRTLCTGVPAPVMILMKRDPVISRGFTFHVDVDHAVEWCEERELAASNLVADSAAPDIETILQAALPGRSAEIRDLARYFVPQTVGASNVLAVQGDNTRDLFLIQKGRISALLKAENGDVIRLRTLGPGSIVGEVGMYLGLPRTASLIADIDSIVWRLPAATLVLMERDDPRAALALHELLAHMLARRLVQANQLLEISLR